MIRPVFISIVVLLTLNACTPGPSREFQLGKWRGEFTVQGRAIPFNFSVEDDTAGIFKVYLINGNEKVALDSVYDKGDSIIIPVDIYDARLIGKIEDDSFRGFFRKNQENNQGIPFSAKAHQTERFIGTNTSHAPSVAGKWSAKLISRKDKLFDTTAVVLLLDQSESKLTGTIMTTTGDYRYFEGVTDKDTIRLSAFSGSNPILLTAAISGNELSGELLSPRGATTLIAVKDQRAALPDPYGLTYLKNGNDKLTFTFPDFSGKPVSLQDGKYKGKVVIVTIMGSWCPNCVDEAAFLSPWYEQNKQKGVEIIGLTFERKDDINFARERISKFVKRLNITYDILFAGISDKASASRKLPQLNAVLSFPTTFIIDRHGKVRSIHTGFTGPATGKYYEDFISDFNREIALLIAEPS